MRRVLFLISFLMSTFTGLASAQILNAAVVDMHEAMKSYYKTDQEVDRINRLAQEKIRNVDERKAAYQKLTAEMVELDKAVRSGSLSETEKQGNIIKLQSLAEQRSAKAAEISDYERKTQNELFLERQRMEAALLKEIREQVNEIVKDRGFDMVFDKSFLPNDMGKVIIYTSPNVKDLTAEVISKLNAEAPAVN